MTSLLQLMLPWQFSPTVVVALLLTATLYGRGAARSRPAIPAVRQAAFYLGLLVIYCALQTSWEYYAGHMIFVLQLQHFALHDLGPALLAWATPRAVLTRGLPRFTSAATNGIVRLMRVPMRVLLNPFVATSAYVAALLVWLWPPITFDVMLSNELFRMMSWGVVLGALPFWSLVLDPRPYPLGRLKPGHRIVALHLAMLPIVLTGASLTLLARNLYPVYAVCGRFLPIPAIADQQLGGAVMWFLGAALFAVVFFVVLGRNLEQEEAAPTLRVTRGDDALPVRARVRAIAPLQ